MRSSFAPAAWLLLPSHASCDATTQTRPAYNEELEQPSAAGAPLAARLHDERLTLAAAQRRPARTPQLSSWRRLDENLKQCTSVDFTTHVITTQADAAMSVSAADLDGDADLDVLSASSRDDKVAWYENLDGTGDFSGPQRVITTQAEGAYSIAAADLDGDNDLDVLSASADDNKIAWYENVDGAGKFSGPQRVITTQTNNANSVAAADLDGDGDLDVLSASLFDNKIAWYENLDGAGDFSGPQRVITIQADGANSLAVADLDGDADLDVVSASGNDDTIAWYENLDGAGDFSGPQRVITTQADGAYSVAVADLDGDGDLDVLSASYYVMIAWYENLDGAGHFSEPQRVSRTQAVGSYSVTAADLDGDGDLDVLAAFLNDDKVVWYENLDGRGDFSGRQRVITTQANGPHSVAAADLDGDGDLDVLSASAFDDKIAWYENECVPMTPQPTTTPQRTPQPDTSQPTTFQPTTFQPTTFQPTTSQPTTSQPTPEPTYWGPQVFGKRSQTAGFERFCVAWCVIFGAISIFVLGYVMHASWQKDKNLARIILTIVLSHYDYSSDTLFIGFHNFVTPTLFVAALITYLLPLAFFIVVYRHLVRAHLTHIYISTKAKILVRFDSWDALPKALTEIGSFALFPFAFAASTFVYLIVLFVFISCKLMTVSFFAVKFFETGGFECTEEDFELMFKRSLLSELVFESSGELIIVLVDTSLRAQQDIPSYTGLSSWAILSVVGSSLMLAVEFSTYLYYIVWMGLGLGAGIAAVSTNLKFTPNEVLGTWFIDRLGRFAGLSAPDGKTVNHKHRCDSKGFDFKIFELVEQREQ